MNTIPTSFPTDPKRIDPEHQPLAPFPELVEQRYQQWLGQQQGSVGVPPSLKPIPPQAQTSPPFTDAQRHWLDFIKIDIALNGAFAATDPEAYRNAWESVDSRQGNPFGVAKRVFGADPKPIIEELNEVLVA